MKVDDPMWSDFAVVLGYDVRSTPGRSEGWSEEVRDRFLLRPDIEVPLSVDRMVWPAAVGPTEPNNPLNLWNSISSALAHYPCIVGDEQGAAILVELAALEDPTSDRYWKGTFAGYLRSGEDRGLVAAAEVLGYDVSDRYLLSGLSNCRLSPEELRALREEWREEINSFGLFSSAESAVSFSLACDRFIPEHAPFCGYRMRRVRLSAAAGKE